MFIIIGVLCVFFGLGLTLHKLDDGSKFGYGLCCFVFMMILHFIKLSFPSSYEENTYEIYYVSGVPTILSKTNKVVQVQQFSNSPIKESDRVVEIIGICFDGDRCTPKYKIIHTRENNES